MRDRVLLSKISSIYRNDYLYVNSFSIVIATIYFMNQTSTIHAVDTGLIYAFLKLSFSNQ